MNINAVSTTSSDQLSIDAPAPTLLARIKAFVLALFTNVEEPKVTYVRELEFKPQGFAGASWKSLPKMVIQSLWSGTSAQSYPLSYDGVVRGDVDARCFINRLIEDLDVEYRLREKPSPVGHLKPHIVSAIFSSELFSSWSLCFIVGQRRHDLLTEINAAYEALEQVNRETVEEKLRHYIKVFKIGPESTAPRGAQLSLYLGDLEKVLNNQTAFALLDSSVTPVLVAQMKKIEYILSEFESNYQKTPDSLLLEKRWEVAKARISIEALDAAIDQQVTTLIQQIKREGENRAQLIALKQFQRDMANILGGARDLTSDDAIRQYVKKIKCTSSKSTPAESKKSLDRLTANTQQGAIARLVGAFVIGLFCFANFK